MSSEDRKDPGERRFRAPEVEPMATVLGDRVRELEGALASLRDGYDLTLGALVTALDFREQESGYHSHRVALFSCFLGLRLGLDTHSLENLFLGALLHDIGKICTPDTLLTKAESLTPREWEIMRQHAEMGASIVSGIGLLRDASDVPMTHHEAWDGSGYPRGLRAHEIPQNARIFAVADSYDAIRSERPWKAAEDHDAGLAGLRRVAGTRLDPALVEVFCEEPPGVWSDLHKLAGALLTFQRALLACRQVSIP